jgi:hypothetical protein
VGVHPAVAVRRRQAKALLSSRKDDARSLRACRCALPI